MKCEKRFLYSHEYRDHKKAGKKSGKQFFQKHTNSASKKCWGKNRLIKVRKNVFYIQTNIVTKIWGKNARNNFSRNTRIVRAKSVAKKIIGKKSEKRFLYLLEYHDQKMAGKKRTKQFFQKQKNSASKKFWEINRRKKCLNRF